MRSIGFAALLWSTLLVIGISSMTVQAVGPAPSQRNWVIGKLDQSYSFGQTFVVDRPSLAGVRVLLFGPMLEGDDMLTLRLHYPDSVLPDLAAVTLPVRELSRQGMTMFAFEPLRVHRSPYTTTTTLKLTLEAPILAPEEGVSVIAGPDTYGDGMLFINDRPRPFADLAFQPVYRAHWIDPVLPVSRLADGKPGLLGWPPLYAALAYICLCLLSYGLFRLWRQQ